MKVLDVINYGTVVRARHRSRGVGETVVGWVEPRGVRSQLFVVEPREVASTTADAGEAIQSPRRLADTAEWSLLLVPVAICLALVVYAGLFLS